MPDQFPKDYFIELTGDDFRVGRLTVNKNTKGHDVFIDIVLKDSMKIWKHIGILTAIDEEDEAIKQAVQSLSNFINSQGND